MWMVIEIIGGILLAAGLGGIIIENAKMREDLDPVPPTAGLRPEESEPLDNHGCYVEPDHVRVKREMFVVRAATSKEIKAHKSAKAIRELMQSAGRN
jgi:hypothetical protein